MSRDVAGGEHGPRRQRYTEAWFLWDRADISRALPVVSFHHTELVDSEPAASLPVTVSFACTPLLGSSRFMLPTNHAATATIFDFLQLLLSPASNLCTRLVGFCVRVQLLFLEPVASRALSLCDDTFTNIIVMSGNVQRSSRMYADTWCIWREAGSQRSHIGPHLYFVES